MIAYIFVYNPSKFRVDGEHPLKRYDSQSNYSSAESVIEPGQEVLIDKGVYGIWSDADDIPPEIQALSGAITVDYDQVNVTGGGKDPWPSIVDSTESSIANDGQRERVLSAFPRLRDQDLQSFISRGI
jgi:hypothetical protein